MRLKTNVTINVLYEKILIFEPMTQKLKASDKGVAAWVRTKAFLIAQTGQSREVFIDTTDTVTTIVPTAALTT